MLVRMKATAPVLYNALRAAFGDDAGEVSWLINQRVMELNAYEKPPEFLNNRFSPGQLNGEVMNVGNIWDKPELIGPTKELTGARYWEILWLKGQGFCLEALTNAFGTTTGYRFLPPEAKP